MYGFPGLVGKCRPFVFSDVHPSFNSRTSYVNIGHTPTSAMSNRLQTIFGLVPKHTSTHAPSRQQQRKTKTGHSNCLVQSPVRAPTSRRGLCVTRRTLISWFAPLSAARRPLHTSVASSGAAPPAPWCQAAQVVSLDARDNMSLTSQGVYHSWTRLSYSSILRQNTLRAGAFACIHFEGKLLT